MREAIDFGRTSLPKPLAKSIDPAYVQSIIIATMRFDLAIARATRNTLVVRLMELLLNWVEPMRPRTLKTREDLARLSSWRKCCKRSSRVTLRRSPISLNSAFILERTLEEQMGRRLRRRRLIPG